MASRLELVVRNTDRVIPLERGQLLTAARTAQCEAQVYDPTVSFVRTLHREPDAGLRRVDAWRLGLRPRREQRRALQRQPEHHRATGALRHVCAALAAALVRLFELGELNLDAAMPSEIRQMLPTRIAD